MFSVMSVCHSVCPQRVSPHVTITHDAIGQLQVTWDQPSDIFKPVHFGTTPIPATRPFPALIILGPPALPFPPTCSS